MDSKRKVYVLLTRLPGNSAKAIHVATGCYYTHASIGLEEDPDTFYSFLCRGFVVEKITRYVRPNRTPFPCQLYELEVSEKAYKSIKNLLESFVEKREDMRYTKLGVVLSMLRIPYRRKHHYFCSQFVAAVLKHTQVARLKKDSALYHPGDFENLPGMQLRFQGNLQSLLQHFSAVPYLAA